MIVTTEKRDNSIISKSIYDYECGEIIPAIASFDDKGIVVPLYFRINGDAYRVIEYKLINNEKQRVEYYCSIVDNGIKKQLKVQYWYSEAKWIMRN